MEDGATSPLTLIEVHEIDSGFVVGAPPSRASRRFTVACVSGALDEPQSRRAFACDVLAVDPRASLVLSDLPMLRQRAGSALDERAKQGDRIGADSLRASGLALFTMDDGITATIERILALAGTLWALVRARRFTSPNWASAENSVDIEVDGRLATIRLLNKGVPSFSIPLLEEIDTFFGRWRAGKVAADTLLFTSATPATFSMGGDLATIASLARARDTAMLRHYAHVSVRVVHALWTGLDREVLTIGAVEGKAFGSGFEAILACQLAIAGPKATFAFPEARFGLFPGMGATSLLGRRATPGVAEALIVSGRKLDAQTALEIGAIDGIAGCDGAEAYIKEMLLSQGEGTEQRRRTAMARRQRLPYSLTEAIAVVDVWVDAVLNLTDHHVEEIERIARMQRLRSAIK